MTFRGIARSLAPPLLLVVLALCVYSNSFSCDWQFDDYRCIVSFDYAHASLASLWQFSPQRSLGFVTFWLNYKACGYALAGWHAVNLALHIVNVLLVFGIARWLFNRSYRRAPTQQSRAYATVTAVVVAAIFAAHPVQTQAVTYVVQRLELLGTMWVLLAFWCIGMAVDADTAVRRAWGIAGALAALALGAVSKETIVVAPVLACACLVLLRLRTPRAKLLVVLAGVLAVVVLAIGGLLSFRALTLWPTVSLTMAPFSILWGDAPSAGQYYPTQARVLLLFLRLCFLPYGQRVEYPEYLLTPSQSFFDRDVLLALGVHVVVIGAAIWMVRRRPVLLFGVLWFYAFMLPSSILPNGVFEHRLYGALSGMAMAVAISLGQELLDQQAWVRRALSVAVTGMAACLVLSFAFLAHVRNEVWRSDITLWRDAVEKAPGSWRANANYGNALMNARHLAEALPYLEKSFRLESNVYLVAFNLGTLYYEMDEAARSVDMLAYALAQKPSSEMVSNSLGAALLKVDRIAEGTNMLARVDSADSLAAIGMFFAARANHPEACAWYTRAVARNDAHVEATYGLMTSLLACGRTNEALAAGVRLRAIAEQNDNSGI